MPTEIDNIPVWGDPLDNAVEQMRNCAKTAHSCALMADHHLGYAMPIGGVCAYEDLVSPSGVGYDIACGNKAVKLDIMSSDIKDNISKIMDDVWQIISFGVGRKNSEEVDHELFNDPTWDDIKEVSELKDMARSQLGTVGSGNHYVDIFEDDQGYVWIGVHFGSRGLGHKLATHFVKAGGGKDSINADPVLLDVNSDLGQQYIACMQLAGKYAYAGRDWVCERVAKIIGGGITKEVHNHHNFAWLEEHNGKKLWVVRKGATPAFPGQEGFVGGSMGEMSVILEGIDSEDSKKSLYSTVHGAGRVMSRTQASGKTKWKSGKKIKVSEGMITREMMDDWVQRANVELRGAGTDESPHCYKRLDRVLDSHAGTIKIKTVLKPLGVAMAGSDEFDPYKD